MTQVNQLAVEDLIREIGTGRATVKFILDRFSSWLSPQLVNGQCRYSPSILPLVARIRDLLSSGILPSQIEEILQSELNPPPPQNGDTDIRMNREAISFIQDMVKDIRSQQERIAAAHEQRAQAEERKATAIEKRAQAEEKKAEAMNNIAAALQEMNQLRAVDTQSMKIAQETTQALTMDDSLSVDESLTIDESLPMDDALGGQILPQEDWDDEFEDPLAGLESLLDPPDTDAADAAESMEPEPAGHQEEPPVELMASMDDLSLLMDAPEEPPGLDHRDIDDLSALIDTVSAPDPEYDMDRQEQPQQGDGADETMDMDDLSLLVDEPVSISKVTETLDDLSLLVDSDAPAGPDPTAVDDLSLLVDGTELIDGGGQTIGHENPPLDDLSLLIDPPPAPGQEAPAQTDDLWLLVDKTETGSEKETVPSTESSDENASSLDDPPIDDRPSADPPLDDLSALIDPAPSEPSLKPEISPEEDMAKYKAAVMKIIIELKSRGLTPQETTQRLNRDQVATLSGKPTWRETAIAKIYGFIDSAK